MQEDFILDHLSKTQKQNILWIKKGVSSKFIGEEKRTAHIVGEMFIKYSLFDKKMFDRASKTFDISKLEVLQKLAGNISL